MAAKPAMIRPRQRVTSRRSWVNARRAGSNVIDANRVTNTVAAAAIPRPAMNGRPISSMPSSDSTTVMPANTTARPAVSIAPIVACSGVAPARVSSRYRVMMNSA